MSSNMLPTMFSSPSNVYNFVAMVVPLGFTLALILDLSPRWHIKELKLQPEKFRDGRSAVIQYTKKLTPEKFRLKWLKFYSCDDQSCLHYLSLHFKYMWSFIYSLLLTASFFFAWELLRFITAIFLPPFLKSFSTHTKH